jgi:hypothetical protein
MLLAALAILGAILLIVGAIIAATSGGIGAFSSLKKQFEAFAASAQTFEAPGVGEYEFKKGGAMVMLHPDGQVGDRRIGTPDWKVDFEVTVTDIDGNAVPYERNEAQRQPGAPFELLGFFEIPEDGVYRIDVATSDGTPAAIMVGSGTSEEVETMLASFLSFMWGVVGGCFSACGCVILLAFGVPALVLGRSRPKVDPLEQY